MKKTSEYLYAFNVIALAMVLTTVNPVLASTPPLGSGEKARAESASKEQFETISISQAFFVKMDQTKSIKLDHVRYVKNLYIQAAGVQTDSQVEIYVNGEIKGSIYAPGADPSFYITVNESARSIEFRHRSGASLQVLDVKATVSVRVGAVVEENEALTFYGSDKQIVKLAFEAQRVVDSLQDHASGMDYLMYLYPVKKAAGLTSIYAASYGSLSYQTIAQMRSLADQIAFAAPHLSLMASYNEGFDLVVRLLNVKATIDDLVN